MHVLLLLAVVGTAVAAPQFASSPVQNPSSGLIPPPTNFNSQSFGAAAPTNSFAPPARSFTPTSAVFIPRGTNFQTAPVTNVPGRSFSLDSNVFTADGGDSFPSTFQRGNFERTNIPTSTLKKRTEYLNSNGEFSSSVEQSDGAHFSETGSLKPTNDGLDNVVVKAGSYGYTSPEGVVVYLTYTADEYGFHPVSNNIPVNVAPVAATF